jgi:hypothetical protein
LCLLLAVTIDVHSSVGGSGKEAASASLLTADTSRSTGSSTNNVFVLWWMSK